MHKENLGSRQPWRVQCKYNQHSKYNSKDNPIVTDNTNNNIDYFILGPQQEADKNKYRNHTKIK